MQDTTLEERASGGLANEKADELAMTGAVRDGAEVAECVPKEAMNTRKKVYLA